MAYHTFRLTADKPIQVSVRGKLVVVDSTGVADGVDITLMRGSQEMKTMPGRRKAFKCWQDYDGLILRANVNCDVALFLSNTDVSLGFTDGMQINVAGGVQVQNSPENRVPVELEGANVNVLGAVQITNTALQRIPVDLGGGQVYVTANNTLTVLDHKAPAVIGVAPAALVNDNTYKRLRIMNNSAAASVAIGGAGVTMANAALVLRPGDVWIEDDAPGAAWFAVADMAGADVRVMGVK